MSVQPGTAWDRVGMDPGELPGTCPCRHGSACAQAGRVIQMLISPSLYDLLRGWPALTSHNHVKLANIFVG